MYRTTLSCFFLQSTSILDELKDLRDLLKDGILTKEEFDGTKAVVIREHHVRAL